jgi:hypothetical protein
MVTATNPADLLLECDSLGSTFTVDGPRFSMSGSKEKRAIVLGRMRKYENEIVVLLRQREAIKAKYGPVSIRSL